MRRTYAFGAIGILVGLLVSGAIAEASVRLFTAVNHAFGDALHGYDLMAAQIEPVGALGYRQRPNAVFHYTNGTTASANVLGYRGPVISRTALPGTIRIILLGGSTTHGFGVPDSATIDTYMRHALSQRHPESHFEVVNLAFDGYDSYQLLERFRAEGVQLHPDIVFFNEGINDVRNAWFPNLREADPRTLIWEGVLAQLRGQRGRGRPTVWTLTKHYLFIARIPGFIHDQLRRGGEKRSRSEELQIAQNSAIGSNTEGSPAANGPPYPDAAAFFDRHVRELTSLALQNGASVVLSTPPSALRRFSPTATSTRSYWMKDAKTTQAYRDDLAHELQTIAVEESRQDKSVRYISPTVPMQDFLDDCHLTASGNKVVADAFADAVDSILVERKSH